MKGKRLAAAAAILFLLSACGQKTEEYDALAVFSAQPSNRSDYLTNASDVFLWDKLGLGGVTVTTGDTTERIVDKERWLTVRAELSGEENMLYLRRDPQGEWRLDLTASFGVNPLPLSEWGSEQGFFTARVTASLGGELPAPYQEHAATHYTVEIQDYTGEGTLTAVFTRESSDGEALHRLLSDGGEHRVLLRLRELPAEGETPLWRVTQYVAEGWFNEETELRRQNTALLEAVRQGRTEQVEALLTPQNVHVTDENGDGLLFLALRDHHDEIAELLIRMGVSGQNDNIYWHNMCHLLDFEREDVLTLTGKMRKGGGNAGCTAESLEHYLVQRSNNSALMIFLSAFEPQGTLSMAESWSLAERYGLELETPANLLDVAVLEGSAQTAETLLIDGLRASALLKEKLRLEPTSFSEQMLAVLGQQNYFGVMDEVLEDYGAFRKSYLKAASEEVKKFHEQYNRFLDAAVAGKQTEAYAIMDSGLLSAIEHQLAAVQRVEKPRTEAIGALWDLMFRYADMMDTAGYYYKRTAYSTYAVFRHYNLSRFQNRLERGEELRNRFLTEFETYERLYRNTL